MFLKNDQEEPYESMELETAIHLFAGRLDAFNHVNADSDCVRG
jgi:hypothetical protein